MAKIRPLTADQIERLAERQTDALQAPPRTVGSVLVSLLVAGVGGVAVAAFVFLVLSSLGAPGYVLLEWSGRAGLGAACLYLAAWSLPLGKAASLRWWMEARREVHEHEFRKLEAYREIVALKAAHAAEVADLRAALAELRGTNKVLRSEKKIITERQQNPRWTPRSKVDPETRKNAETILQHWFTTLRTDAKGSERGEWWSRPKATSAGWTKAQHEDAAQLLEDAELTGQNGLLPFVLPDVRSLADALHRLDAYCNEAQQEPAMPGQSISYVELDEA